MKKDRKENPCDCFRLIKGRRNFTRMWLNFLEDNLADIASEYGNVQSKINAARVDIQQATQALDGTRQELADCIAAGCIGPETKREFNRQLDQIDRQLQDDINKLDALT